MGSLYNTYVLGLCEVTSQRPNSSERGGTRPCLQEGQWRLSLGDVLTKVQACLT
jgi:hypothetical protein